MLVNSDEVEQLVIARSSRYRLPLGLGLGATHFH